MPQFTHRGVTYNNPVELALDVIGGKWKMPILWRLKDRVWRYGELKRGLGVVTHKMLTQHLREMERDGLLTRTVYAEVPPKVEYAITALGRSAIPAVSGLRDWGLHYRRSGPQPADEPVPTPKPRRRAAGAPRARRIHAAS